jgi:hypothetical protein
MLELNNLIARLEIRIEQYLIHLSHMDKTTSEAKHARTELYAMLRDLRSRKRQRQEFEYALATAEAMSDTERKMHATSAAQEAPIRPAA